MKDCKDCVWCYVYGKELALCIFFGNQNRNDAENCPRYCNEKECEADFNGEM